MHKFFNGILSTKGEPAVRRIKTFGLMAGLLVLLGCNTNLKELQPAASPSPSASPATGMTYPVKVRPDGQLEPQLPPQVLQWDPISGKLIAVPASASALATTPAPASGQQTYPITVIVPGQQQQQSGVSLIGFGQQQQQQQTGTTTTSGTTSGCAPLITVGQGVLFCQIYGLSTFALDATGTNYTATMAAPMRAILVGSQTLQDLVPGNVSAVRINIWNRGVAYAGTFAGNMTSWLKANTQAGDRLSISYNLANNGQVWHILLGSSFLTSELANEDDGTGGLRLRRNYLVERDPPALASYKDLLAENGLNPAWADTIVGTVR
ncbi:MAG: hypothetical protein AAB416_02055 [Patescibacteria group bacterium]